MERELAANRLQEMQELHEENKKLTREVDTFSAKVGLPIFKVVSTSHFCLM